METKYSEVAREVFQFSNKNIWEIIFYYKRENYAKRVHDSFLEFIKDSYRYLKIKDSIYKFHGYGYNYKEYDENRDKIYNYRICPMNRKHCNNGRSFLSIYNELVLYNSIFQRKERIIIDYLEETKNESIINIINRYTKKIDSIGSRLWILIYKILFPDSSIENVKNIVNEYRILEKSPYNYIRVERRLNYKSENFLRKSKKTSLILSSDEWEQGIIDKSEEINSKYAELMCFIKREYIKVKKRNFELGLDIIRNEIQELESEIKY